MASLPLAIDSENKIWTDNGRKLVGSVGGLMR